MCCFPLCHQGPLRAFPWTGGHLGRSLLTAAAGTRGRPLRPLRVIVCFSTNANYGQITLPLFAPRWPQAVRPQLQYLFSYSACNCLVVLIYYTPPACSPLCPMRLVCTVTVYSTLAKCNRPKWPERSAARAAVRAVRSGPLLIEHGTMPYHYR
jgi:hypothetical protein